MAISDVPNSTVTFPISLVADWHEKFQVHTPIVPTLDSEVGKIRCALLSEECDELLNSLVANDRPETLDALCDLQYVLSGTILALGLRAEYSAKAGEVRRFYYDCPRPSMAFRASLLMLKIRSLQYLIDGQALNGVLNNLHDSQLLLDGLVIEAGFVNFEGAFLAVHMNNWGKTWSEDQAIDAPEDHTAIPSGEFRRFVVKDSAGKVRKPPGHPKVDLTPFL